MRWKMRHFSAARAAELTEELGLYSIVAGVLAARGIETPDEARTFMNPSLADDWSDPAAITGLETIAERLWKAVAEQRSICVFGDYDVDGITASAIMSNTLAALGAQPSVVLPLRSGEGYGFSEAAVERVLGLEPDVLLTVDCGVSGASAVERLAERGIEVLITDHHEASGDIPVGVPVADPKLSPGSPAAVLAGAGVALKLADLLGARAGRPDLWKSQLDLAALGTIADCMPLTGENRTLVSAGIKMIGSQPRPGIQAVDDVSGCNNGTVSSEGLSYGLIPRINAAGRVSDPMISFDLLCTTDPKRARFLAQKLEGLNNERKSLEGMLFDKAVEQAGSRPASRRSLVVGGEQWHEGVRGIVASRLTNAYGVPSLVFSFEGDMAIGSGRTAGTIDLHAAVGELSDMLIRFGGHQAAVGLSIERARFDEFSQRLEAVLGRIPADQFEATAEVDCMVGLGQLSIEAVDELSALEPFGIGNPEPRFLTTDVMLEPGRFVGAGGQHLSLTVTDGTMSLDAIWFNTPYRTQEDIPPKADIVYRVQVDEWRGRRRVKLVVLDAMTVDRGDAESWIAEENSEQKNRLEHLLFTGNDDALNLQLATTMSGSDLQLRAAQKKCLDTLGRDSSTLAIMATGRGKSLIFHTHAAKLALHRHRPSLFIYPLRSLIGDQEYYLGGALGRLGLSCASLTGSTSQEERARIERNLGEGTLQVVLSTPEFVLANAGNYGFWREFGFIAVDEAHHIATSDEAFRPDYSNLRQLRSLAPDAVFLALSATSDQPTTDIIVESLGIKQVVVDTSKRPNLQLVDKRGIPDRDADLVGIVTKSSKSLVYASSRAATIDLCRLLRKELREQAQHIAFYNAALTSEDRQTVEQEFRSGGLNCVVATSAFGEGINIPDIRDVVLYDLPYSIIDFNQMAGRAGRDGRESFVHVLAQASDVQQRRRFLAGSRSTGESRTSRLPQEKRHLARSQGTGQDRASVLPNGEHCLTGNGGQDAAPGPDEVIRREDSVTRRHQEMFADWLFKTSAHGLSSVIQRPLTPLGEGGPDAAATT